MSPEKRVIDDLVILGRAVPERIRNGRITVCTAGYSEELGFVRIYPTRTSSPLQRWNIVEVPVERNPQDTRDESWKIQGSRSEWSRLDIKIKVVGTLPRNRGLNLIANLTEECVGDLNTVKRSLGIIKPTIEECYFCPEDEFDPLIQTTLFGPPQAQTKQQFREIPKIKYRCPNCKNVNPHDQTVLEWGFYEWFRKNPENIEQVWENAQLVSDKHLVYFFVGNTLKYKNAFLIISVIRLPKDTITKSLIPYTKITYIE